MNTKAAYSRFVRSHQISMLKARFRSAVTGWLGEYPALYFPIARRLSNPVRDGKAVLVTRESDLVVEGFPGSGNTFAVAALSLSQGGRLRLAHHLHVPAQIKRAVHLGKPVLVVLRPPKDSVSSFLLRADLLRSQLRGVVLEYIHYHTFLHQRRDHILFADFAEVTHDFGDVVRRLEERFAMELSPFDHDEQNVAACFEWIDAWYRRGGWIEQRISDGRPLPDPAEQAPGPSDARRRNREILQKAFEDPALAPLWREAEAIYRRLAAEVR